MFAERSSGDRIACARHRIKLQSHLPAESAIRQEQGRTGQLIISIHERVFTAHKLNAMK